MLLLSKLKIISKDVKCDVLGFTCDKKKMAGLLVTLEKPPYLVIKNLLFLQKSSSHKYGDIKARGLCHE